MCSKTGLVYIRKGLTRGNIHNPVTLTKLRRIILVSAQLYSDRFDVYKEGFNDRSYSVNSHPNGGEKDYSGLCSPAFTDKFGNYKEGGINQRNCSVISHPEEVEKDYRGLRSIVFKERFDVHKKAFNQRKYSVTSHPDEVKKDYPGELNSIQGHVVSAQLYSKTGFVYVSKGLTL